MDSELDRFSMQAPESRDKKASYFQTDDLWMKKSCQKPVSHNTTTTPAVLMKDSSVVSSPKIWKTICQMAAEMIREYPCIGFPNFGTVSLRDYKGGVRMLQFGTLEILELYSH